MQTDSQIAILGFAISLGQSEKKKNHLANFLENTYCKESIKEKVLQSKKEIMNRHKTHRHMKETFS